MSITVRPVEYADQPDYTRLGGEAFGAPVAGNPAPTREEWAAAGFREWGAFDGDDLAARLRVHGFTSWFHGAQVPTAGIAGVAVEPERRGSGHLARLFAAALDEARERGEAISTLYPTAPGIYRGLGYEVVGSFDDVDVPLQNLSRVAAPAGVVTRRATVADYDAMVAVHRTWAAAQNGPVSRAEKPFWTPPEKYFADYSGVTLAIEASGQADNPAGKVVGFASWIRGEGYAPATTVMEVDDLIALTPDAARALWRTVGSFSTVVGTARVSTSGLDPAWLVLPDLTSTVHSAHPYMLRVLDVPGALGGVESPLDGVRVPFAVRGAQDLAGAWTLTVSDGVTHLEHDPVAIEDAHHERPALSPNGLALLYAGAQSAANLRIAGHLTGATDHDAVLTALFAGRQVHVRDYF
jgi:predicted acetyltransferase